MQSAKTLAPLALDALVRSRLIGRFDTISAPKAYWIYAPGGYGKSTLAASYIQVKQAHHLWYRLDHGDVDLAAFLDHLRNAAGNLDSGSVKTDDALPSAGLLIGDALVQFSRTFFRRLFSNVKKPFVLAFDQIETLPADGATVQALAAACDEIQDGVLIFLIGRNAPPPLCSRLELNRVLERIGPEDLSFTADETRALLAQSALKANDDQIETLQRRTRGWAAGIRLLFRGVNVDANDGDLLDRDQKHLLAGYFTSEVLAYVDDGLHGQLMSLALFDSLPLELVENMAISRELPRLLQRLADDKLFVDRLSGTAVAYRMHPLFRDYLNDRLVITIEPQALAALKRRAAINLLDQERYDEAIGLFHDCGALDQVCMVIAQQGPALVTHAQFVRLREWLALIPDELRTSDPWMMYWDGASLLFTEPAAAKKCMAAAYEVFESHDDAAGIVLSWSGCIDAIFNEYAVLSQLDIWLDRFDAKIGPRLGALEPAIAGRAILSRFNAVLLRRPDDASLPALTAQVGAMAQHVPDPALAAFIHCQLFLRAIWAGDLPAASIELSVLRDLAGRPDAPLMTRLFTLLNSATLNLFNGQLAESDRDSIAALELTTSANLPLWDAVLYGHRISALIAQGRVDEAENCLPALRRSLIHDRHSEISRYYGFMALFAARRGAAAQANSYIARSLEDVDLGGVPMFRAIARLTIADARIAIDPSDPQITPLLEEALSISQHVGNSMAQWVALMSLIGHRQLNGAQEVNLAQLNHAFDIGARNHYRHFITWPAVLVALACELALRHDVHPEYARELILHNKLAPSAAAYVLDGWPWPVRVRTLGRFVVLVNDKAPQTGKKQPKVPLRLLRLLIASGGRNVSEQLICDRLWPQAEGDQAADNLGIAIHRLRDYLKIDCVIRKGGQLTLDNKLAWVDIWALQRALRSNTADVELEPTQLAKMYQGPFLKFEDDVSWAIAPRTRLHDEVVGYIATRAKKYLEQGDFQRAEEYCKCGLRIDDLVEEFYRVVMQCQLKAGNNALVAMTYRQCEAVLLSRLQVVPARRTADIYKLALGGA